MKKIILLMTMLALSLAACGVPAAETEPADTIQTAQATDTSMEEPLPTPGPTPTPTPEPSMLMSFFGEKYNPFYIIEWPQGYSVAEYAITNFGGEEHTYNEIISYCLTVFAEDSVRNVVEYMSNLIGDTENISDNVKKIEDGEEGFFPHVNLKGYLEAIDSEVGVTIRRNLNNYDLLTIQINVCINELEGYDIDDYIEIIDLNFDENIIPDWGGETNIFKEQEPLGSALICSLAPLEMMSYHYEDVEYYVSCTRAYKMKTEIAEKYLYNFSSNYGEMLMTSMHMDFELGGGMLYMGTAPQNDILEFTIYAENPDKNICDYGWQLQKEGMEENK